MKIESVEEYIARGGTVEVVPPAGFRGRNVVKVKAGSTIMSLSEGADLFGEKTKADEKQAQQKASKAVVDISKIDPKLLEELRAMGAKV